MLDCTESDSAAVLVIMESFSGALLIIMESNSMLVSQGIAFIIEFEKITWALIKNTIS